MKISDINNEALAKIAELFAAHGSPQATGPSTDAHAPFVPMDAGDLYESTNDDDESDDASAIVEYHGILIEVYEASGMTHLGGNQWIGRTQREDDDGDWDAFTEAAFQVADDWVSVAWEQFCAARW